LRRSPTGRAYASAVLPGLLLTSLGIGLALPTASVAITSGVQSREQGLAGGLFVTGQQTGAAIGLAVLATIAATRTDHAHGSLTAGYRLSFLIATGMALGAVALIAAQLNARACQTELARQQQRSGEPNPICTAEASLRRS
jgi:MFS family permease